MLLVRHLCSDASPDPVVKKNDTFSRLSDGAFSSALSLLSFR